MNDLFSVSLVLLEEKELIVQTKSSRKQLHIYMKFFLFLLFLPGLLFSEIVETFYGDLDVQEPVLLELIQSPSFQRLKKIHQYGVSYYDGSHMEEYTRYDHSMGVFAILRLKGCSLQEQVAGLLHDVSHTVFSHVVDWVFSKEHQEEDYQNEIHETFLQKTELGGILSEHSLSAKDVLPLEELFPVLDQPLPGLCADRIDYNLQGAFHKGFLTQKEAKKLLEDLHFVKGQWVCSNPKLMEKVVRFSLFMSKNCWGSAGNHVRSRWLADAMMKAVEIGLISEHDIHFTTDELVWRKLCSSKDPYIAKKMQAISHQVLTFRILKEARDADTVVKVKFRVIDPLIKYRGKNMRFTSLNPRLAKAIKEHKKEMDRGWAIQYLSQAPLAPYDGPPLKKMEDGH